MATTISPEVPTSRREDAESFLVEEARKGRQSFVVCPLIDAGFFGEEGGTLVFAEVEGLPGGDFHGFHVHAVGECEPDDGFLSAGGHFNPGDAPHGDHAGDMPVLLATEDGVAVSAFITDRFTAADLLGSEDGTAVIVHEHPDNYANIPDRY
jgi:superoxide dismutase, Cu-Zn family